MLSTHLKTVSCPNQAQQSFEEISKQKTTLKRKSPCRHATQEQRGLIVRTVAENPPAEPQTVQALWPNSWRFASAWQKIQGSSGFSDLTNLDLH